MEMGAKTAIIPPDKKTKDYLKNISKQPLDIIEADDNASYEKIL